MLILRQKRNTGLSLYSLIFLKKCEMSNLTTFLKNRGGFYYVPLETQKRFFDKVRRKKYIKLPKVGTNPRGVEITKEALSTLLENNKSRRIEINWQRTKIDFNPYKRWVDFWREE